MEKIDFRSGGRRLWLLLFGGLFLLILRQWAAAAISPPGTEQKLFSWHPFLAPFHAVVLHFPIGFVTMAFILEIYRLRRPSEELRRVTTLVIWLSLMSGVVSASLGLLRADSGGYESHALAQHRRYGLAVPIFTLVTLALHTMARHRPSRGGWLLGYRISLVSTLALLVVAGHFGGNLTHGSRYLVENAPAFVRDLLDRSIIVPINSGANNYTEGQQYFTAKVRPILETKCQRCHGPEKQKGGYRLDTAESARKGGASGKPAVVPGDVIASNMARLILLPPDHDDVMPPGGKEPLGLEEISILVDWIRRGAEYP